MSVYSMTGYASVQRSLPLEGTHLRAGLELRAVNSRFLDLSFRLPEECRHLEPQLRERLSKGLRRGKVELRAQLEREDAGALPSPLPNGWRSCRIGSRRCSSSCHKPAP